MVRKKKVVAPVVAKPLSEKEEPKRSIVSSFVRSSISSNATENVTDEASKKGTEKVTKKGTKNVTKPVTKKTLITKSIVISNKEITAKFESDKVCRPNYNLSEDTVKKIEKVSELLGYKKAEFVDIYLNGTLTKILKKLEKEKKAEK